MATSATHSKVRLFTHFLGAAIDPSFAGVAENSGTAAIVAGLDGGVCGLTTGASSGNRSHVSSGLNTKPSSGSIWFEARVAHHTAITTREIFIGLTDTVAQETPIALGASDALTSNATDAVGFACSTVGTGNWKMVSVANDVDGTTQTVNVGGVAVSPVADVYDSFGIEVAPSGKASFYFNGQYVGSITGAVTPTVLLSPIVCLTTRTAGASTSYVDFIDLIGATR